VARCRSVPAAVPDLGGVSSRGWAGGESDVGSGGRGGLACSPPGLMFSVPEPKHQPGAQAMHGRTVQVTAVQHEMALLPDLHLGQSGRPSYSP
jgi:hypothetical protein